MVSVIIPVYNGEKFLRDAIESILAQTYPDFELLVIDDASIDGSLELIRSYDDPRMRILENPVNLGLSGVRNRGIKEARGEYIAFLDCDDISLPTRLEKQVRLFETNPEVGLCGTWTRTFGDTVSSEWRYPAHSDILRCRMIFDNPFATSSVMLRSEVLARIRTHFDTRFPPAEDYELWERISKKYRVANIPEVLNLYRIHDRQTSSSQKEKQRSAVWRIQLRQLEELGIYPSVKEKDVHLNIGVKAYFESSKIALLASERWLSLLKNANNERRIYPEPFFSIVLSEKWHKVCSVVTRFGWWTLKRYLRSALARRSLIPKMMIKCLLRWDSKTRKIFAETQ